MSLARPRAALFAAALALASSPLAGGRELGSARRGESQPTEPESALASTVVVVPAATRATMNDLFADNNRHWDELADLTTLEQMLGTIRPTQREYLGCLRGRVARDTVWVAGWEGARALKQLQFAVDGSCDHVRDFLGTWHTHPYRAGRDGRAVKERRLSPIDLATFAERTDRVTLVVWDVDSLDAAIRRPNGRVVHPAVVVVR